MKNTFIAVIMLAAVAACGAVDGLHGGLAQKYVPGIEDLPVYSGFNPVDNKNIAYDSETGRIVDAGYVSSYADIAEVRKFYADTLPQLGWKKNKNLLYEREGEKLKVVISSKNGLTFLKFVIRPAT